MMARVRQRISRLECTSRRVKRVHAESRLGSETRSWRRHVRHFDYLDLKANAIILNQEKRIAAACAVHPRGSRRDVEGAVVARRIGIRGERRFAQCDYLNVIGINPAPDGKRILVRGKYVCVGV